MPAPGFAVCTVETTPCWFHEGPWRVSRVVKKLAQVNSIPAANLRSEPRCQGRLGHCNSKVRCWLGLSCIVKASSAHRPPLHSVPLVCFHREPVIKAADFVPATFGKELIGPQSLRLLEAGCRQTGCKTLLNSARMTGERRRAGNLLSAHTEGPLGSKINRIERGLFPVCFIYGNQDK